VTKRDGYVDNPNTGYALDDEDTATWRVSLAYEPTDWFANQLVLNGFYESDTGAAYKLIYVRPGSAAAPDAGELAFYGTQDFHTTNAYSPRNGTRIETFGFGNVTSWEVGENLTLKNILGYRDIRTRLFFDLDGVGRPASQSIETVKDHHWSDEVQVLGTAFEDRLTYVGGLYWFREEGAEIQVVELQGGGPNNTITDNEVTNETLAVYAQGSYALPWVDGLSLTAGWRYTQDKRELTSRNRFYSGVCRILTADVNGLPLNPCVKSVEETFEEPTYTVSLDWKVNPDLLVYVATRRGYQAGGFTNSANRPSEFTPYLPQTVTDWEVGMKADWQVGGMRGRTNIALYKGEYEDIQRLTSFPAANPSGLPFTQNRILNAATSTIQGLEVDFQIRPVEDLLLSVAYARTDAAYDEYMINGQDYSGAPFAGVPEDNVSWLVRWDTPFFQDFTRLALQIDGSWQSWTVVSDATSYDPVARAVIPFAKLDDYGTVNARVDLEEIGGRPLQLSFWVRNLTDEEYYTAGIDSSVAAGGRSIRLLGAPRTFGAEISFDF
jgi:iron complex outermembrane receptor protein